MANRIFTTTQALNKEVKIIAGRFDDTPTKKAGLGYTVATGATGVYTVTFDDAYSALLAATATVQSTAGTDDFVASIASHDVVTAKTIVFHVAVAGVLTVLGSADELHFTAILQNSSIPSV